MTLSITMLCHYAECRYAECRNAECRYAECRGAALKRVKKITPKYLSKIGPWVDLIKLFGVNLPTPFSKLYLFTSM
jgi:hypothetical protein